MIISGGEVTPSQEIFPFKLQVILVLVSLTHNPSLLYLKLIYKLLKTKLNQTIYLIKIIVPKLTDYHLIKTIFPKH